MRVLITCGSKRGGTLGIAEMVAGELRAQGFDVDLLPPREALRLKQYDAAIVGGALYANRWHAVARRFVAGREKELRKVPVWLFSSGPLDESAETQPVAPQVKILMERIGAQGHVTFGGRLRPDAKGFPASAMAKKSSGDWRHPERVLAWAEEIARALPTARPLPPVEQPDRSLTRVLLHGFAGWVLCAVLMASLLWATRPAIALGVHLVAAPILFGGVAWHYFKGHGVRAPWATALWFAAIPALLDLVVVPASLWKSVVGFWLPITLIWLTTWAVGAVLSMLPFPRAAHSAR